VTPKVPGFDRYTLIRLESSPGVSPFSVWFVGLRDAGIRVAVTRRLQRIESGNFGDTKPVGHGVHELRLDVAGGIRLYYGQLGSMVVLLIGGDKSSQARDIRRAQEMWRRYSTEERG